MISDRNVAFYREHGYVVVPGVLEQSNVDDLRRDLDAIVVRVAPPVVSDSDRARSAAA